jgi:hypothetical protein
LDGRARRNGLSSRYSETRFLSLIRPFNFARKTNKAVPTICENAAVKKIVAAVERTKNRISFCVTRYTTARQNFAKIIL